MQSTSWLGNRPVVTFDLTGSCPLRCDHCYFYADPPRHADLSEADFLAETARLRDAHGFRSAFWIGGEPLLRLGLLRRAMALFPRNAISTSGMVPIPTDLGCGLLVSLDGPATLHELLRGQGTFDRVMANIATLPRGTFALSTTLTTRTLDAIEALPELLEETRALGVLVGFAVGAAGDPLCLRGDDRDRAVDRLLVLSERYPGVLLNTTAGIESFRPANAADVAARCIYGDVAVAFDVRLRVKAPCTFGEIAACDACGCAVVAEHRALRLGNAASEDLLRALFPRAEA